jgi:2-methylisocitrate lyase-like PEP mutase family enzyme
LKQTTRLRQLLKEGNIIVKPGAYNALSAMLIESAGFKAVGVSGFAVSATLLGKPDAGFTTMSEVVMVTKYIADAVNIPVIADADTGWGNALNVMRTTEEFIKAGAAAIHIEDQLAPKRCGHVRGKQLISLDEAVGKFKAANMVRNKLDPDFVLIARTDARGAVGGSLEEAIRRGKAYVEAGADMVFPDGLLSEEELVRFVNEVKAPIHYNRSGLSPLISLPRLQEIGVPMVSNPSGSRFSAAMAIQRYMQEFYCRDIEFLKEFNHAAKGTIAESANSFNSFIGFPKVRKYEEMFLSPEEVSFKYEESIGHEVKVSDGGE